MTQSDSIQETSEEVDKKDKIPYEYPKFSRETCCRICQTVISSEKLISPCLCKGSMAFVHLSCLERWLNQSGRDSCELCTFRYEAEQTRRYGLLESLRIWYRHPRHRLQLKSDIMIGLVLTVITAILCSVCLGGMKYFVIEGIRLGISYVWTEGVISFFLTVILIGYLTTLYVMLRDHMLPWYNWWNRCVNVRLVLDMELVPVLEDDCFMNSPSSLSLLDLPGSGSAVGVSNKQEDPPRIGQDAVVRIPQVTESAFGCVQNQQDPPTTNNMTPVISQIISNLFNPQALAQIQLIAKESDKDCDQNNAEIPNNINHSTSRHAPNAESTDSSAQHQKAEEHN